MSLPARWPSIYRTCKSTVINNRTIPPIAIKQRRPCGRLWLGRAPWVALLIVLLTGCAPVRPIVKIGLIAPFEGLYRDSGYAALAGMRAAIEACTPPGLDVLPVALDDGGAPAQAQRSAQKLVADPTVIAVIGPLLYPLLPSVGDVIRPAGLTWIAPPTVLPSGSFVAPDDPAWLAAQVEFIQSTTQPARLLVVGLPPGLAVAWEPPQDVVRVDDARADLANLAPGDSVLWLGTPEGAAVWLNQTQAAPQPSTLWLSAQAGGEIVQQHIAISTTHPITLHWVNWRENGYTDGSQAQTEDLLPGPINQITYHATCQVLSGFAGTAMPVLRP